MSEAVPLRFLKSTFSKAGWLGLVLVLTLTGCNNNGESDKTFTPSTGGVHPEGWMSRASDNFHGWAALYTVGQNCVDCHGTDFDGGTSNVSCVDCHSQRDIVCINCHGGLESMFGSPPYGLDNEISDTAVGVGAHTVHVMGTGSSARMGCQECHIKPSFVLDSAHLDFSFVTRRGFIDSVAEVTWGGIAVGANTTWNRVDRTCAGTYCHGSFEGGNANNLPVWTSGKAAACGSCHDVGADAAKLGWRHEFHVTSMELLCNDCHSSVVDNSNKIINKNLHVNATVDILTNDRAECGFCHEPNASSCTTCHGGVDNQTGAPPRGLRDELLTSSRAVGAHSVHVEGGLLGDAFDCTECHIKPATVADPGHYDPDSAAEITWGTLAGSASHWNRASASCSGTYCHGNFSGGKATNTPIWTGVNQATCGSCHDAGSNPQLLSGRHRKHIEEEHLDCNHCHDATADPERNIIGRDIHVDGKVDVVFAAGGTYSDGTCSPACHERENWLGGD